MSGLAGCAASRVALADVATNQVRYPHVNCHAGSVEDTADSEAQTRRPHPEPAVPAASAFVWMLVCRAARRCPHCCRQVEASAVGHSKARTPNAPHTGPKHATRPTKHATHRTQTHHTPGE